MTNEAENRILKHELNKAMEQKPCQDVISRQAFMSHIESEYRKWGEEYDAYQVLSDLDDFPSIQPEIIHCRDCKKRMKLSCPFGITVFDAPYDGDFCSRAERKET